MTDRAAGSDRLGGGDDGVGVDSVMAIEVGDRAGLAEMLDPERARAMAATAPSQASVAGWPSSTVTSTQ